MFISLEHVLVPTFLFGPKRKYSKGHANGKQHRSNILGSSSRSTRPWSHFRAIAGRFRQSSAILKLFFFQFLQFRCKNSQSNLGIVSKRFQRYFRLTQIQFQSRNRGNFSAISVQHPSIFGAASDNFIFQQFQSNFRAVFQELTGILTTFFQLQTKVTQKFKKSIQRAKKK